MHEITIRKDGKAEIAWANEKPWHELGTKLDETASIEDWVTAAGLDWKAVGGTVCFNTTDGMKSFPGKQVIFRDDTLAPLSVVSEDFKVVQPREVIEFFKDAAGQANMKLEVAGSIYGGRRFWATARVDEEALKVNGVDEVRPYVLLITSLDGTLATTASLVNTRVVCSNTARIALQENGKRVRQTHATEFDASFIKRDLGIIDSAWSDFKSRVIKMAETKISEDEAKKFFTKLLGGDVAVAVNDQSVGVRRQVDDLMRRYTNGIGAEMSVGTQWGLYNAVTEATTWRIGRASLDNHMMQAVMGKGNTLIQRAEMMLAEA